MPRPAKSSARESELLDHALEFFSKDGFRETSLQDIADHLGITRPLFYYYFDSKEELLWRLIGHLGDALLERARPILESDNKALDKLDRTFRAHIETLLSNDAAFRIYFAERHLVEGKRDRRLMRGEIAYLQLLSDVIEDGQEAGEIRPGNARILARLSQGTANSLLRWYERNGPVSPSEITDLTTDAILRSLRA